MELSTIRLQYVIMSANNINTSKKLIRNKKIKLDEKQARQRICYMYLWWREILQRSATNIMI